MNDITTSKQQPIIPPPPATTESHALTKNDLNQLLDEIVNDERDSLRRQLDRLRSALAAQVERAHLMEDECERLRVERDGFRDRLTTLSTQMEAIWLAMNAARSGTPLRGSPQRHDDGAEAIAKKFAPKPLGATS